MKTQHSEKKIKKKIFLSSFQQSEQIVGGQGQRQGHQLGSEGYNDVGIDQGDTTGCGQWWAVGRIGVFLKMELTDLLMDSIWIFCKGTTRENDDLVNNLKIRVASH